MSANLLSIRFHRGDQGAINHILAILERARKELSETEDATLLMNADMESGKIYFQIAKVETNEQDPAAQLNCDLAAYLSITCMKMEREGMNLRMVTTPEEVEEVGIITKKGI